MVGYTQEYKASYVCGKETKVSTNIGTKVAQTACCILKVFTGSLSLILVCGQGRQSFLFLYSLNHLKNYVRC